MRSAISPERSALELSRLDRAGRETRSTAAAAVTERPAGSMISVPIKSPGWGGFFIGIVSAPFVLVVIFQVQVAFPALPGRYGTSDAPKLFLSSRTSANSFHQTQAQPPAG